MSGKALTPLSQLKTLLLIVNPVSGRRVSVRLLPDIIAKLSEYGYLVSVLITTKQCDATEFAKEYGESFDAVACIGGDGTLNETVTGLYRGLVTKPFAYIPTGSTNVFAITHSIPFDVVLAAEKIGLGRPESIDLGSFGEEKIFSYVAAFGAFSWLSYTTPQDMKNLLGHSAYLLDAVKDLPKITHHHLRFTVADGVHEGDYIFGAVCNATSVAGTFSLPRSEVDTGDGIFEVLLVKKPNSLIDLQSIITGVLTEDYSTPFLDFFHAGSLEIDAPEDLEWALDGERFDGMSHISVRNLHGALKLIK